MEQKKLVILGGGESGTGAAKLGVAKGFEVFLSDKATLKENYRNVLLNLGVEFEEGKHTEEKVFKADLVIKSPGIPDNVPLITSLRKQGVPVISEIEFGGKYTKAKTICVTGSNGKTTTVSLLHHMLIKAGLKAGLVGNYGASFCGRIAEDDQDFYVIEVSSFQLDGMFDFKADIAILLNITPDHLDRYEYKFENYIQSKFRIIQNQTAKDSFIYCLDDMVVVNHLKNISPKAKQFPFSIQQQIEQGAELIEDNLIIKTNKKSQIMTIQELALQGKHNIYNSMAAGIAGRILELRKEIIKDSLSDFQNVEHRLEFVTSVSGVKYINDSKATNVNSTWYALETVDAPAIWIVGGVDKGNDYSDLKPLVADKVKAIICLGSNNDKIKEAFAEDCEIIADAANMREAVYIAYRIAEKKETVLLSPACASFDLFENYEDRGQQFKEAVRSL